jgi:hypothetical protein
MPNDITFVSIRLVAGGREVVADFSRQDDIRCMLEGVIQLGPFLLALVEPPKLRPPAGGKL